MGLIRARWWRGWWMSWGRRSDFGELRMKLQNTILMILCISGWLFGGLIRDSRWMYRGSMQNRLSDAIRQIHPKMTEDQVMDVLYVYASHIGITTNPGHEGYCLYFEFTGIDHCRELQARVWMKGAYPSGVVVHVSDLEPVQLWHTLEPAEIEALPETHLNS